MQDSRLSTSLIDHWLVPGTDDIHRASLIMAENWIVFAFDASLHASDHRVVMLQIPGDTLFATPPVVSIDGPFVLPLPAVAWKKFTDDDVSEWQYLFMGSCHDQIAKCNTTIETLLQQDPPSGNNVQGVNSDLRQLMAHAVQCALQVLPHALLQCCVPNVTAAKRKTAYLLRVMVRRFNTMLRQRLSFGW